MSKYNHKKTEDRGQLIMAIIVITFVIIATASIAQAINDACTAMTNAVTTYNGRLPQ